MAASSAIGVYFSLKASVYSAARDTTYNEAWDEQRLSETVQHERAQLELTTGLCRPWYGAKRDRANSEPLDPFQRRQCCRDRAVMVRDLSPNSLSAGCRNVRAVRSPGFAGLREGSLLDARALPDTPRRQTTAASSAAHPCAPLERDPPLLRFWHMRWCTPQTRGAQCKPILPVSAQKQPSVRGRRKTAVGPNDAE